MRKLICYLFHLKRHVVVWGVFKPHKLLYFPVGLAFLATAPVWLPLMLLVLILYGIYHCGENLCGDGCKAKHSGDL